MDSPQHGDICLVDFDPSVGHEYQKKRPAVVVQSNSQMKRSNLITIIPLTSQVDKKHNDDILVQKSSSNRLWNHSLIKVHSITSFDRKRFIKKIGKMDPQTIEQIKSYLSRHFDL